MKKTAVPPEKQATGPLDSLPILQIAKEPLLLKRLSHLRKAIYTKIALPAVYCAGSREPVAWQDRRQLTYTKIKTGEKWADLYGCAWFQIIGSVPEAYRGRHVVLRINIGGEGLVYREGEPVCAISHITDPTDFLSASHGKSVIELKEFLNEKGEFCIDLDAGFNGQVMNLPVGKGIFGYAQVSAVDDSAKEYYYDYLTVAVLFAATKEAGERASLKNALDLSYRLAKAGENKKAQEALAPILSGEPQKDFLLTAVGHSHLDLAWLWPVRETIRKSQRTFLNQLRNIEAYPDYIYGASQPWQFEQIKKTCPALFARIQEAVKAGRIELQGGMWVEADTNLSSGEALIRQLYYGKQFFRDEFGEEVLTCWLPDVFGYNGNLPQILKKSDIPYFMTIKLSWNEHNKFPYRSFLWEGIDDSRVLVHMPPDDSYNSCGSPACAKHAYANYPEREITHAALVVYGVGDGGGGPGEAHNEFVKRQKNLRASPRMITGKASDFFKQLSAFREKLPVYKGELYLEKHQGTYTTQGRNKRLNRLAEYALQDMEALCAMAYLQGMEYPQEAIDRWWKEILLYQFHDIIPGSAITRVYDESRERYRLILSQIAEKRKEVLRLLCGKGEKVIAFNPTSFARSERTPAGVFSAAPYGFAFAQTGEESSLLKADNDSLTNGILTVHFNADGEILSLKDADGTEYAGAYLNRLTLYSDPYKFYNAWDIDWEYGKKKKTVLKADRFTVFTKENKVTRRNHYRHGKTQILEEISLTAGSDVVEISVKCDFHETFHMLRADFRPNLSFDTVKCDIQMGTIERSAKEETPLEKAQFEICAHKYVDVSDSEIGFSLLNNGKYGHRVKNGLISLNLLRSPVYPDRHADRGKHEFTYALYGHRGKLSVETLKRAYQLNKPLLQFTGDHLPCPLVRSTNETVVVETIKKAYGKDALVIRLFESQGKEAVTGIETGFSYRDVQEVNLMEEHPQAVETDSLVFAPFEIKTLLFTL